MDRDMTWDFKLIFSGDEMQQILFSYLLYSLGKPRPPKRMAMASFNLSIRGVAFCKLSSQEKTRFGSTNELVDASRPQIAYLYMSEKHLATLLSHTKVRFLWGLLSSTASPVYHSFLRMKKSCLIFIRFSFSWCHSFIKISYERPTWFVISNRPYCNHGFSKIKVDGNLDIMYDLLHGYIPHSQVKLAILVENATGTSIGNPWEAMFFAINSR